MGWLPDQAWLLEHNVRFGDPECQCLMVRLRSDLLQLLLAAADGNLSASQLQWSPDTALTVTPPASVSLLDEPLNAYVISPGICFWCAWG